MREPPFTFGDYEVTSVIAQGGMGVVYRARQKSLGRFVALKMIRSAELASPEELQRFRTEAEAAATLDHPGIVPIHEVGEALGQPYFSMRLVEGGSLESRKQAHVGDPRWAAAVVERVARAVQHAHVHGILHRDLKPGNVLLEDGDRPVVTDFGLARRTDAAGTRYTLTGMILGTPAYMAPEQAKGDPGAVTAAADIWSLGVLLYELATGQLPFRGSSMMDLLGSVIADEPTPPSRILGHIPLDFETICLKCLRKPPGDRYLTAGDLADDLSRFLRGEPVAARPLSTIERAVRWTRRHPTKTVTVLFLFVALLGGLLGLTAYYRSRATAEKDAARRARAGEYLARARSASESNATALAGLYFAGAQRLLPSTAARIGVEAHRVSMPLRVAGFASGPIYRLVFDPAGRIVVGTTRGVWIWDPRDGSSRALVPGPYGEKFHGVALHGTRLAIGTDKGRVELRDLASGDLIASCPGEGRGEVASLSFVAGGSVLAFSALDEDFRLWDLDRGTVDSVRFEPIDPGTEGVIKIRYVKADPTATKVLVAARIDVGGRTLGQARLWDVASARFLEWGIAFDGEPWCADFSRDETRIAVCGALGCWVSGGGAGDPVAFLPSLRPMGAVAFGAEADAVVVGDNRGTVTRWDPAAGHEIGRALLPACATYATLVSPDGTLLYTGGEDGLLRCWAMPTGEPDNRVLRGLRANLVALDADEQQLLAVTTDGRLALADVATGAVTYGATIKGAPARLTHGGAGWWLFLQEPDAGHWIEARAGEDRRIETRTVCRRPCEGSLGTAIAPGEGVYVSEALALSRLDPQGREEPICDDILSFDVSADGQVLTLLDPSPAVRVRVGGAKGKDGCAWPAGPGTLSVAADPRGLRFAASIPSSGWQLRDAATGEQVGPTMRNLDVAERFSPNGEFLVTGMSKGGWVRFVDTKSGEPVGRQLLHVTRNGDDLPPSDIGHVAFSRSGARLVVVCGKGDVYVWNLDWLGEKRTREPEAEWERAQLAALCTLDDKGERQIPIEEWQRRRDRWFRAHGE